MAGSRYFVIVLTLPLIVLGCLLLILTPVDGNGPISRYLCIGLLLGTMFGQTTIAASWTALGPGPLIVRLPLSLLWLVCLLAALGVGCGVRSEPAEVAVIMLQSLSVQWLVSQVPLWLLVLFFGLQLHHGSEPAGKLARRQFGIGQLMVVTAIIGVMLGIGRLMISSKLFGWAFDHELPVFLFLVASAIVMTLPLVFAAFLNRGASVAMLAATLFIGLVSLVEMPLLMATISGPGPEIMHLVWINFFTTAWVLALVLAVRRAGYRLNTRDV